MSLLRASAGSLKATSVRWRTYWLYAIHVPRERRQALLDELLARGIEVRPFFEPLHRVHAHSAAFADDCPVAENLSASGLIVPCSTSITDAEVDEVACELRTALRE